MEFLPMSRFRKITRGRFPSFSELRTMRPVTVTMDLEVMEEPENVALLDRFAAEGVELFPIRRVVSEARAHRADFPSRVLFEMTSICNARCQMCPQMNLRREMIHMDGTKYKSILDELDYYGLDGLWLYHFGESLTHPQFREIIDYVGAKRNLGCIWLSTNGILMNEGHIRFLLSSALSYLNFSLQSITVENYRKIAPTSPAEKIISNLESLVREKRASLGRKPFFRLQIIEQEHTLREIDPFLRRYFDKCDLISVNMLEHTDLEFNRMSKTLRRREERRRCTRLGRSDCFINSDGSVAVCDNAYNNELDIGNVWKNTVCEIWNGPERRRILQMNESGSLWDVPLCSECTDYDL